MVRASTLELQQMHDILKRHGAKYDPETKEIIKGSYRRNAIKACVEHFRKYRSMTRGTIYNWLKKYPARPVREPRVKRVIPKEVRVFRDTHAYRLIEDHKYVKNIEFTLREAWKYTGVDPADWSVEHVKALREPTYEGKNNILWIDITGDISSHHATNIRRFLDKLEEEIPEAALLKKIMKDVKKRPSGPRKEWYLDAEEIHKLIPCINELDTLVFTRKTLEDGARPIATAGKTRGSGKNRRKIPLELRFTPERINEKRNIIRRWESKKGLWARAKFQPESIAFIKKYIADMRIEDDEIPDVFKKDPDWYSDRIKEAGKRAKIPTIYGKGGGAYILRHTFATQSMSHNVSLESVMEQGGWKGSDTLMQFYVGLKEEKMDFEFLDIPRKKEETWREWLMQFDEPFKKRYKELLIATTEIKMKRLAEGKTRKTPKKRPRNWNAIAGQVASEKTPAHLKKYWKPRLALHKKGLSDAEIEKRMQK